MTLLIDPPPWLAAKLQTAPVMSDDAAKMRFVIDLARHNVLQHTGGPFAAALFTQQDQRLVCAAVNSVQRLNNSVLHAETLALMLAETHFKSYSLRADNIPELDLVTSSEPCAMCLGAIFWSGVRRVVCGAYKVDAAAVGFDEGPIFAESYAYMEERGVSFVRGVCAAEARDVLRLYRDQHGLIYNG